MDENVVFDNQNSKVEQPVESNSQAPGSMSGENLNPPVEQPVITQSSEVTPEPVAEPPVESITPTGKPPPIRHGIFGGLLKKIIIGVVIFVVLLFLVILFLPKGSSNTKAKLVWWGLWEDQSVMQPLIDDFHKSHPNITIEYIKQDPKLYREKLTTRIKNGTGPDIFRFHNTWVPMLSDNLLPLSSDVITPSEFKKSYYPVMQKDLVKNGAIYGIPLGADTLGLFINTEIFKSAGVNPPQNWEHDFVEVARQLTVKDENGKIKTAGAALGTYGNITHAPDILSLLFIQQGVDMNKFSKFAQDEKDAINFYTSFAVGDVKTTSWDNTLDESILSFAKGNLAMYIGFSWDIFRIQALNKDLHFETHPIPQLFGRRAALASYWAEGVSAKSKSQKAALLFMQYLSKKETAQKFYTIVSKTRQFGEPYARSDLQNSLKDNKILFPFVTQLDYASSSFFASDTNDGAGGINALSNNYLGNAINSIVNDNSSAQSVVETLEQGVSQTLQKYGVQ